MRNLKSIRLLFFIAFFVFYGCSNNDERLKKEIVGTWSYSSTEEIEEDDISTTISINGTSTFSENGTCEDIARLIITYIDEEGYQTNLKYKAVANGKYEIQKSYIIYDYKLENINIELLKSDDYEISDFINEHYIPQLKHEILVNNKEKILELTEKFLKTECEVEGEKEMMTYIRQTKQANGNNNQNQQEANNLITQTSIAGVKIIGMTPQKIKPYINEALTWEYIEEDEEIKIVVMNKTAEPEKPLTE